MAAYLIIGILHEWAHALTAYALNVPAVLTHLYVHINRADGTANQRVIISAAGPVFCLIIGLICWFGYSRRISAHADLLLLYLGWFGVATLLGNLISTPFVGDFSAVTQALQMRMSVRYGLTVTGAVLLCGLAFFVGSELRQLAPPGVGALKAMIGVIMVPVIGGTAALILISLPMPSEFALGRVAESSFWFFGALGTLLSRKHFRKILSRRLSWADFVLVLLAVGVLRLMVGGIFFVP